MFIVLHVDVYNRELWRTFKRLQQIYFLSIVDKDHALIRTEDIIFSSLNSSTFSHTFYLIFNRLLIFKKTKTLYIYIYIQQQKTLFLQIQPRYEGRRPSDKLRLRTSLEFQHWSPSYLRGPAQLSLRLGWIPQQLLHFSRTIKLGVDLQSRQKKMNYGGVTLLITINYIYCLLCV